MSAVRGFIAAVALLATLNLAGIWLPGWTYVPVNLVALAVLGWIARRAGATGADLGIERRTLRDGAGVGLAAGLLVAAGVVAVALVPATRAFFEDQRAAGIGVAGLLYQVLVRIPLGTALFEEGAFRGVLLGLGRTVLGRRAGTLTSAVLFGLWHVVPVIRVAEGNGAADDLAPAAVVAGAVASTAAAGLVFTWLRDHSGSLAAPVLVHALVNAAAFAAAWTVV
jgi:membrane protease YdiL (CAAX protease family)